LLLLFFSKPAQLNDSLVNFELFLERLAQEPCHLQKSQAPNPELQQNPKDQLPKPAYGWQWSFYLWDLRFWVFLDLELGI